MDRQINKIKVTVSKSMRNLTRILKTTLVLKTTIDKQFSQNIIVQGTSESVQFSKIPSILKTSGYYLYLCNWSKRFH